MIKKLIENIIVNFKKSLYKHRYRKIKNKLKKAITKEEICIFETDDEHRGIGKTHMVTR